MAFIWTHAFPMYDLEILTALIAGFLIPTFLTGWDDIALLMLKLFFKKNYWSAETVLHIFPLRALALAIIAEQHSMVAILAKVLALAPFAPRDIALF